MARMVSPELRKRVLDYRADGLTYEAIGRLEGLTGSWIRDIAIRPRLHKPTPEERQKTAKQEECRQERRKAVLALQKQGKSLSEIGKELGISRQRVSQIVSAKNPPCNRKTRPPKIPKCKHCKHADLAPGRRGLCMPCYRSPEIRILYPRLGEWGKYDKVWGA